MGAEACASNKAHLLTVARMMALDIAAKMLGGQHHLAAALSIGTRAARAKCNGERGVTYSDLTLAAKDLRVRATKLIAHADKLQALADKGE